MWIKADHAGQSHKSVSTAISSSIRAVCLGRMQAACVCGLLETKKCNLSRNILFWSLCTCRNICYCISLVKPLLVFTAATEDHLPPSPTIPVVPSKLFNLPPPASPPVLYFSCTISPASFKPSLLHLILISIISVWINLSLLKLASTWSITPQHYAIPVEPTLSQPGSKVREMQTEARND